MKKKNVILITIIMMILTFTFQVSFAKIVIDSNSNVIDGGIISELLSQPNNGSLGTSIREEINEDIIAINRSAKLYLDDNGTLIADEAHMKMPGGKKIKICYEPQKLFETIVYKTVAVEDDNGVKLKTLFEDVKQDVKDSKGNYKEVYLTLPNVTGRVKINVRGYLTDGTNAPFREYTFDLTKNDSQTPQLKATMDLYHNGKVMSEEEFNTVSANPTFELKYDPASNFDTLRYTKTFLNPDGTVANVQAGAVYLLVYEGEKIDGFDGTIKLDLASGSAIRLNIDAKLKDGSFITQSYNLKAAKENLKADISLWDNGTLIKNKTKMKIEAGKTLTVNCSPKENFKTIKYIFTSVPDESGAIAKVAFLPIEQDVQSAKKLEVTLPDVKARIKLNIEATLVDGTKAAIKEYTFDLIKKENEVTKTTFDVYYNGDKMEEGKTYEVSADPTFELKCTPEENFESITYNRVFLNEDGTNAEIQESAIYLVNLEDGFNGAEIKINLNSFIKWNITAQLKDGTHITRSYKLKATKENLKADISLWDNGTLIKNKTKMKIEAGKTLTVNCSPKENFKTIKYIFTSVPDESGAIAKVAFLPIEQDVQSAKKLEVTLPDVKARIKLNIEATLVDGTKAAIKEYTFDLVKKIEEVTSVFEVYYDGVKMENGKTYEVSIDPTFELKCTPEENFESITYNRVFLNEDGTVANIQENAIYMVNFEDGLDGAKIKISLQGSIKWNINAALKNGKGINYSFILKAKKELEAPELPWVNISSWAKEELLQANENELIPEVLFNQDYTQGVSRREFVAIAIKLYENIAKKEANLPNNNPFSDTTDEEVLKAYNLGITNGVSETEFAPDKLITREQMATMMTRVLEKLEVEISISTENRFLDDGEISEWAKEGVYFMNEKGIIKGMENNVFKSKNTATREQALLIANRCMENL